MDTEKLHETKLNDKELEQVSGGVLLARPAEIIRDGVVIVGDAIEAEGGIKAALGVSDITRKSDSAR